MERTGHRRLEMQLQKADKLQTEKISYWLFYNRELFDHFSNNMTYRSARHLNM